MGTKTSLPGLYWNAKTGQGSIDKRVNGKRIFYRFAARDKREAEAIYHQVIAEAGSQPERPPEQRTFEDAATKYLQEETKPSLARDAYSLANVVPWIGRLHVEQIHEGTIRPYVEHRRREGAKSATVRRELAVVRRVLKLASQVWRDAENRPWLPVAPLLRFPDWNDTAKPYPLTIEEQRRLFQELPAHLAEMALFAVNTGARESVVCGLRWEWEQPIPELGTSVFVVPGRHTKNGTSQVIVLNRTARAVIDARRGGEGQSVFGYRGRPVGRMHNTAWKAAWKRAGLPVGADVLSGPHNLRHTFARRLRSAGVALETRKALMHHIDGDITVHYSPAELGELIAAVERLESVEKSTMLRVVG